MILWDSVNTLFPGNLSANGVSIYCLSYLIILTYVNFHTESCKMRIFYLLESLLHSFNWHSCVQNSFSFLFFLPCSLMERTLKEYKCLDLLLSLLFLMLKLFQIWSVEDLLGQIQCPFDLTPLISKDFFAFWQECFRLTS